MNSFSKVSPKISKQKYFDSLKIDYEAMEWNPLDGIGRKMRRAGDCIPPI